MYEGVLDWTQGNDGYLGLYFFDGWTNLSQLDDECAIAVRGMMYYKKALILANLLEAPATAGRWCKAEMKVVNIFISLVDECIINQLCRHWKIGAIPASGCITVIIYLWVVNILWLHHRHWRRPAIFCGCGRDQPRLSQSAGIGRVKVYLCRDLSNLWSAEANERFAGCRHFLSNEKVWSGKCLILFFWLLRS